MQDNINIKKVKIQGVEPKKIDNEKYVKCIKQGNKYMDIIEKERPTGATIKKLSKKEYVVVSTGEIKEYKQKKETTEKTIKNLKETFTRLRQLIRTNFTDNSKNQLFLTLTYKENMTDEKQLYKDFDAFYKRLKRKLKEHKLEYIAVAEPQGRGAWHFHIMLKSTNQTNLYIDNKELEKIWGNGYTDAQRLKSDDVGSYYVAYFTDLLEEDEKGNKKRVKGSRLKMYPKGFKFYRTSRGIEKPKEIKIQYKELEKQGYTKTYATAFQLINVMEDDKILNVIQKETWKKINEEVKGKP